MRYKVVLTGKVAKGFVPEKAKQNIAEYFRLDDAKVEYLFSGKPISVKNNADQRTAAKIKTALEKAGALCRILEVENNKPLPLQGKAKGIPEQKLTEDDIITCPNCGTRQKKTEACLKCGIIFRKIKKNLKVSTIKASKEKKSTSYSILNSHSERKKRDWVPAAVLGAILTVFLIAFIRSLFPLVSDTPHQKDILRAISEKPRSLQNMPTPEMNQVPKSETGTGESANKKDITVPQKSRNLVAAEKTKLQPASDLIAIYPFNGNANDESGRGNHGTIYGASPVKDRFGNEDSAYSFDGVNDYVDIGRPLVSGDFTISFWFKSNGRQNRFAVPISQGNMSYRGFGFTFTKGSYNGFSWGTWKDKKVADPHWGKSAWHTIDFNFPKDINTDFSWHHLTATHKDNIIAVYSDGEFQGTTSKFRINFGNFNFNIGRASANRDFNHRTFNGVIDDIRIYNRALSGKEVVGLYKISE
jgi:hypothetical protein